MLLGVIEIGMLTASAASVDDLTYEIYNEQVTITDCNESASGKLIIPDTIEGYSVTSIGYDAFSNCTGLTSITLPDSLTNIGIAAFWGCTGLASITIPNSITSIDSYSFWGCTGLTSITIPDSVTSIGSSAFSGCAGLDSIIIPNSVTNISYEAFKGCSGLVSISIPESVTKIGSGAFSGCTGITSITIPSNVSDIGSWVFSYCNRLASIKVSPGNAVYHSSKNCLIETANKILISGCKTSSIPEDGSVTSIGGGAFEGCAGLTNITLPDTITSIGDGAFKCCTGLVSISIPGSVTKIGYAAFSGCTGFTSVIIPYRVVNIGDYAFYNCNSIKTIYIHINTTIIGNSAFKNTALSDVYYEGSTVDRRAISFADNNTQITDATWHYNSKKSDMPSSPTNPDNPSNPDNPPSANIPEANIIKGNASNNQKTYDYRTTVTFSANVPSGGKVQWYVDGKKAGTDSTLTVKESKESYIVKVVVTDKNGNQTMDEEEVTIKNGFFDIIIWFFVHLFNPGAYDVKQ